MFDTRVEVCGSRASGGSIRSIGTRRTRGAALLAYLLAAALPGIAACSPDERGPSVLLVSIDTLRRDHVSAYGYARRTTPALDRLAREGALFERAVSSSNWTLPAHASMLTGLSASRHRVEDERDRLPADIRTLAEAFRDAGYATAGFASHIYLDARYGYARGFDVWDVDPERLATGVSDRALAWLEERAHEPFFLFLHYFDPHWDYDPPERFRRRFGSPPRERGRLAQLFRYRDPGVPMPPAVLRDVAALYDAEIAYTDEALGRVLAWLRERGRLDRTAVAVVSDHGEELGDHHGFGHGSHLHSEVTAVPFVMRFPREIARGTRRRDLAGLVDLPATLLALAGRPAADQFLREGRALFEASDPSPGREVVLASTRNGPKRFAVHRGDYAFLGGGSFRPVAFAMRRGEVVSVLGDPIALEPGLFHVVRDPGEQRNLLGRPQAADEADALRRVLRRYARETAAGLLLACSVAEGSLAGELAFEEPLRDEPYALDGDATALLASPDSPGPVRFRVALGPGAGEAAALVFPVASSGSGLRIQLSDGEAGTDEKRAVPADGEHVRVGPGDACRLESRWLSAAPPERVELSAEERARLHALGYVE